MTAPFEDIIGLRAPQNYLARVLEAGRVAPVYCFSGPKQLGKRLLADQFAAAVLRVDPSELALHPDVRVLTRLWDEKNDRLKKDIIVDQIRATREWLQLAAVAGGKKILIVEEADLMNVQAQNAFLKSLEEPHASVMMILLTSNAARLLPTVLSRVVHLRCARASREDICDALVARGVEKTRAHILAGRAAGRPGVALTLLEREETALPDVFQGTLAQRFAQIQTFAKGAAKPEVKDALDRLLMRAHDGLLASVGCAHLAAESQVPASDSADDWRELLSRMLAARTSLQQNGNVSIAFEHFAIAI